MKSFDSLPPWYQAKVIAFEQILQYEESEILSNLMSILGMSRF